jgi:hypothetical protein
MAVVFIPPQMGDLSGGRSQVAVAGDTLRQVIAALDAECPGIAGRLTAEGRIAASLAISIDGTVTSRGLQAKVEPRSEIHIIPAIGGG